MFIYFLNWMSRIFINFDRGMFKNLPGAATPGQEL
jgi:hypothetical protein